MTPTVYAVVSPRSSERVIDPVDGAAIDRVDDPRRGPDPALQLEADHARAGPDDATRRGPAFRPGRIGERGLHVRGVDLHAPRGVQPAVVALGHHGHQRIVDAGGVVELHQGGHRRIVDPPDGHRARPKDGRLQHAPFLDRRDADGLAGAVQDGGPRRHAVAEQVTDTERDDGGHAGPGHAAAMRWRRFVAPDRGMPHSHVGHVHDRVGGSGRHRPDPDAEVARAGSRERRGHGHLRAGDSPGLVPRGDDQTQVWTALRAR